MPVVKNQVKSLTFFAALCVLCAFAVNSRAFQIQPDNAGAYAMSINKPPPSRLDQVVADAIRNRQSRESGYREQALKIYPWICGRCSREFTRENLRELTVHHKDHNHDNNPTNGSNWELLCLYCHDNEHARELDAEAARNAGISDGKEVKDRATAQPFANLKDLLKRKDG
jgi:5-methylcytosine-specific restriction endonuclease McrA